MNQVAMWWFHNLGACWSYSLSWHEMGYLSWSSLCRACWHGTRGLSGSWIELLMPLGFVMELIGSWMVLNRPGWLTAQKISVTYACIRMVWKLIPSQLFKCGSKVYIVNFYMMHFGKFCPKPSLALSNMRSISMLNMGVLTKQLREQYDRVETCRSLPQFVGWTTIDVLLKRQLPNLNHQNHRIYIMIFIWTGWNQSGGSDLQGLPNMNL